MITDSIYKVNMSISRESGFSLRFEAIYNQSSILRSISIRLEFDNVNLLTAFSSMRHTQCQISNICVSASVKEVVLRMALSRGHLIFSVTVHG